MTTTFKYINYRIKEDTWEIYRPNIKYVSLVNYEAYENIY